MLLLAYSVLLSLLCLTLQVIAFSTIPSPLRLSSHPNFGKRSSSSRSVPPAGYYNPLDNGGSILTEVDGTFPPGQGEPLNIIISGKSDSAVLVDQSADGGLQNYFESIGFGGECLGQHIGNDQKANLGDGNGLINETAEMRWAYGDPQFGTCKETVDGGDHFRYWIQNGPSGNSGAIFMATSYELPLSMGHDIIPNGYNLGRDWLIGNITQSSIDTLNLTDTSTFSGTTSANNYTYHSNIQFVAGLLQNTSMGINHNYSVSVNGLSAADGLVAVIQVSITGMPQGNKSSAAQSIRLSSFDWPAVLMVALLSLLS